MCIRDRVYRKPDQVSLAIGKGGLNIRLSKMLTGYYIDAVSYTHLYLSLRKGFAERLLNSRRNRNPPPREAYPNFMTSSMPMSL